MRADAFFAYARERHATHLRRAAGGPRPWSEDPILQRYRFCSVFRELDRTTVWFRDHVRGRRGLEDMTPLQQVLGVILFRTLNRVESGEVLFSQGQLPISGSGDPIGWAYLQGNATIQDVEGVLRTALPRGPWVTGSYIVKTPDGMDKLRGALWIVEQARQRLPATLASLGPSPSLQAVWSALQAYPYIGPFSGFEVVTDLRHLPICREAPDIMTWANAGPGATRGLNWIHQRTKSVSQRQMCIEMQELLEMSKDPSNWPTEWGSWEMREVEHTLCELLKYTRVRDGGSPPRGRFR